MADENIEEQPGKVDDRVLVSRIAEYLTQANDADQKMRERMGNDLAFALGTCAEQWTEEDEEHRGKDRGQYALPVFAQMAENIVGIYRTSPIGIDLDPESAQANPKAAQAQAILDGIQSRSDFEKATADALLNAIACGRGYLHALTTKADDGSDRLDIKVESIANPLSVFCDPFAQSPADMAFCIVAGAISKAQAKSLYGEGVDLSSDGAAIKACRAVFISSEEVPVLACYEKRDGEVWLSRLVGNTIVSQDNLTLPNIPVVPVDGVRAWIGSRRRFEPVGLFHRAEGVQRGINYANSLLIERLALSTKAEWTADGESLDAYRDEWENLSHSNPPVLRYTRWINGIDHGEPKKFPAAVELGDVQSVIASYVALLPAVVGVGVDGIASGNKQMTAEEVLTRARKSEAICGELFGNLASAVKSLGGILLDFLRATHPEAADALPTDFEVAVDAGVLTSSVRKENVVQMLALVEKVPTLAQALVPYIADNLDVDFDDATKQRIAALTAAPSPEALQEAQKENEALKAQNAELQQKLVEALASSRDAEIKTRADLLKTQMNNENDLQVEAMKQAGENDRLSARLLAEQQRQIEEMRAKLEAVMRAAGLA